MTNVVRVLYCVVCVFVLYCAVCGYLLGLLGGAARLGSPKKAPQAIFIHSPKNAAISPKKSIAQYFLF